MKAKNYIYRKSLKNRIIDWFWAHDDVQVLTAMALLVVVFKSLSIITDFVNAVWWGMN